MQTTTSNDGTQIAFSKIGTGPALLIVGGSLADHHFYAPLAEAMAPHFTVYTLDRRGRGLSEDTKPYAPEREIEDVAAVMALSNGPTFLYGHSAGAALALRVAAADIALTKLGWLIRRTLRVARTTRRPEPNTPNRPHGSSG